MPQPVPEPAPAFTGLRNLVLACRPEEIGLPAEAAPTTVWGVLMETGFSQALVTLVGLADGTTSLYLGHGGGVLGAGEHEPVRRATLAFLAAAGQYLMSLQPTDSFPLPGVGRVRFYVLTYGGALTGEADEQGLGYGRHPLSPLFHAGHQVIAEVRQVAPSPG